VVAAPVITLTDIGRAQLSPSQALRDAIDESPRHRARRVEAKRLLILRVLFTEGPLTRAALRARFSALSEKQFQNGIDHALHEGLVVRTGAGVWPKRILSLTDAGRAYIERHTVDSSQQRARQPDVAPAIAAAPAASPAAAAEVSGPPTGDSGSDKATPQTPAAGAGLSAVGTSPDPRPVTRHLLLQAARVELNDYLELLRARDPKLNRLMLLFTYARQEAGLEEAD
jgi:hypothetical protein